MRKFSKIAGAGALFLCVGGWVYSGSVIGADTAPTTASAKAAITEAVAAASQPAAAAVSDPQLKVDAGGNIDFTCQELDVTTALHLLSLQTKRNIIASKEVKGTVTAMLHNVTFTEALNALLLPNGFGYVEKGSFIFVYTADELAKQEAKNRKLVNKIYRLHYTTAKDTAALIKPLMSASGIIAMTPDAVPGLPDSAIDTGGKGYATDDTMVISDYAENLAEIDKALIELDVRPKQVLLEATIMRATLTEDNALGVDLISLSGLNFGNLIGGALSNNINSSLASAAGQTVIGGNTPQANVGTNFASKVPTGGLSVGILSNSVSVFIRALEETTDVTIAANPKILALNKHKGEVFIGDQSGYRTTTTTTTTTQETVQFLDTGTKLVFRPDIGTDGWVRLEVHPEDSSGGVSQGLPTKSSTQVTSNLNCKDGRTVVIGGLFRTQGTAGRGQVPLLGNIPVLGPAFRRTNDQQQKSETIVLLTPHIINDDTVLYEKSQAAAADVNRMVMGNRSGLQPWGRERIAQLWYGKAQDSLDSGDTEKAKMYTDWALNSNPRFIEAIRMREKLTGQRVAEADGAAIKEFVKDVIKADKPAEGSSYFPNPRPVAPATAPAGN